MIFSNIANKNKQPKGIRSSSHQRGQWSRLAQFSHNFYPNTLASTHLFLYDFLFIQNDSEIISDTMVEEVLHIIGLGLLEVEHNRQDGRPDELKFLNTLTDMLGVVSGKRVTIQGNLYIFYFWE